MKKLFILSLLFVPFIALADEVMTINGIDEPQWKDFAPVAYVDVKEPKGLGKFNDVAAYWYKRKTEFNKGIESCREVKDNNAQFTCYQELKVKQYQKNSDYNARIEAMERMRMNPQEMQSQTQNMYPLNGFIDAFTKFQPNEFGN